MRWSSWSIIRNWCIKVNDAQHNSLCQYSHVHNYSTDWHLNQFGTYYTIWYCLYLTLLQHLYVTSSNYAHVRLYISRTRWQDFLWVWMMSEIQRPSRVTSLTFVCSDRQWCHLKLSELKLKSSQADNQNMQCLTQECPFALEQRKLSHSNFSLCALMLTRLSSHSFIFIAFFQRTLNLQMLTQLGSWWRT